MILEINSFGKNIVFITVHGTLLYFFFLKIYYNLPFVSRKKNISYSIMPGVEIFLILTIIFLNPYSSKFYNNKIIFASLTLIMLISYTPILYAIIKNIMNSRVNKK